MDEWIGGLMDWWIDAAVGRAWHGWHKRLAGRNGEVKRIPIPVGGSPTGTGGSPVPPNNPLIQ
jgi:hypothetical protein